MIGDINVCIIKSKDWPIDMAERTMPRHCSYLLVGPTNRNIIVTGELKGAQWKNDITTIIIQPHHARGACQQAIIMHGEGYFAKNKECMGVHNIKI